MTSNNQPGSSQISGTAISGLSGLRDVLLVPTSSNQSVTRRSGYGTDGRVTETHPLPKDINEGLFIVWNEKMDDSSAFNCELTNAITGEKAYDSVNGILEWLEEVCLRNDINAWITNFRILGEDNQCRYKFEIHDSRRVVIRLHADVYKKLGFDGSTIDLPVVFECTGNVLGGLAQMENLQVGHTYACLPDGDGRLVFENMRNLPTQRT